MKNHEKTFAWLSFAHLLSPSFDIHSLYSRRHFPRQRTNSLAQRSSRFDIDFSLAFSVSRSFSQRLKQSERSRTALALEAFFRYAFSVKDFSIRFIFFFFFGFLCIYLPSSFPLRKTQKKKCSEKIYWFFECFFCFPCLINVNDKS